MSAESKKKSPVKCHRGLIAQLSLMTNLYSSSDGLAYSELTAPLASYGLRPGLA